MNECLIRCLSLGLRNVYEKNISENSWSHKSIVLKPLSFDSSFYPIELKDEELTDLKIIGEFITELNL